MKKFLLFMTAIASALLLTSCKVNWFGESFDVPWYFIAIPVVIIVVVSYAVIMSATYVCGECHSEIKPKWYQLSVAFHFGGKRLLKCPMCGKKGFCERKK